MHDLWILFAVTDRRLSISTFNASKELPSQVEADSLLILWLNKVSEGVRVKLAEEMNRLIHDPDPRQRRRNKAAMLETSGKLTTPLIKGDLYRGIRDGQIFAALLLHYAPHACTWKGELARAEEEGQGVIEKEHGRIIEKGQG